MPVITIDFGGTNTKLGVVDNGGKVLHTSKFTSAADKSIAYALDVATAHLKGMMNDNGVLRNSITGIGIMMPSIIDTANNRVLSKYVKYTDAENFDFNEWAKQSWQLPVVVANDAKAALIGEWQYGAGRNSNYLVMMTLGTGVGTAVLNDGVLLNGRHFIGGNLGGHISLNFQGEPCNCGYFGCVETEASTWALPSIISRQKDVQTSSLANISQPQFHHLFQAADMGDVVARQLVQHCLHAWSVCAVNLVHAYDPEKIIISGGIMQRAEIIVPYIQNMIDKYAWLPAGSVQVVAAQQVEFSGLLGMEYLVNALPK